MWKVQVTVGTSEHNQNLYLFQIAMQNAEYAIFVFKDLSNIRNILYHMTIWRI